MEICIVEIESGVAINIYEATSSRHIVIDIPTNTEKPIHLITDQNILIIGGKK